MNNANAQTLADRYVAVWNETDAERRRAEIADLWMPDGEHYVGERAKCAVTKRWSRASADRTRKMCATPAIASAPRSDARALRDVVAFHWEMLPADSETVRRDRARIPDRRRRGPDLGRLPVRPGLNVKTKAIPGKV